MTHAHNYVPVDVTWISYWTKWHEKLKPKHVVLACSCGAVKLVKARLVEGSQ